MEGLEVYTVELYRTVRLACADGMSKRATARHFNNSRDTVDKVMALSLPPGYRRRAPIKRPKLDGFTEIIDGMAGRGSGGPAAPSSGTRPSGCIERLRAMSAGSPAATRS